MRRSNKHWKTGAVLALLGALALPAPQTKASFPGRNGKIIFTRDGSSDIFSVGRGGNVTRLTHGERTESEPDVSADGRFIVFTQRVDHGDWDVVRMRTDGSHKVRLTDGPAEDFSPSWSPKGNRIVFGRRPPGQDDIRIFKMRRDGSNVTRLTRLFVTPPDPKWSPDGDRIAFFRNYRLVTMDPDGSSLEVVRRVDGADFDWRPDGDAFVVACRVSGSWDLCKFQEDGSNFRRIETPGGSYHDPTWSPNGKKIALTKPGEVFTVKRDGSDRELIDRSGNFAYPELSWQPK
jgi:Tol biopolymer transport system component